MWKLAFNSSYYFFLMASTDQIVTLNGMIYGLKAFIR